MRLQNFNVLNFIIYGLLYDSMLNVYKPFSIKFLQRIGGNEFHISLNNSLPGLFAVLALIPGSYIMNKIVNKKRATVILFSISRSIILLLAFVPFLPTAIQPIAFILLISLMNFPESIAQSSLQNTLGTVFRGNERASALSIRTKFGNIFVLIVTILTAAIITFVPKNEEQVITTYQLFFITAFIIGVFEVITFNRFKLTAPPKVDANLKFFSSFKLVFSDKKFVTFLLCSMFFHFGWYMGWPLNGIIQVKILDANEMWLALMMVCNVVVIILTSNFWGKFIQKRGNALAILLLAGGMGLNALMCALAPTLPLYTLTNVFVGFINGGLGTALLFGLLTATPDHSRVVYIGIYNTLLNLCLGVSPFVAHYLLTKIGITNAMFISATLRVLGGILLFYACKNNEKE